MVQKRWVVGIDPSTVGVGVCALEDELDTGRGLRLVDTMLIQPDGQKHFRLFWILEKLTAFFRKLSDRRLDVAIERAFVGSNPATSIVIGEARGVVLAAAGAVPKARVFDYSPGEHKKSVAGNGQASKYQAMLAVRLLLKIDEDLPLDVADACCIAVHHAMRGKAS